VRPLLWFCLTKCVTPLRVKKERRFVCSCTSLASHLSEHFVIESTYKGMLQWKRIKAQYTHQKLASACHIHIFSSLGNFFILGKNKIKAHYCSTCCLFYFNFCFTIIILCETIYNGFMFQHPPYYFLFLPPTHSTLI
jgi:hypothetical protein